MVIEKAKIRYNILCGDDGANNNEDDDCDSTNDCLHQLPGHALRLTSSFY